MEPPLRPWGCSIHIFIPFSSGNCNFSMKTQTTYWATTHCSLFQCKLLNKLWSLSALRGENFPFDAHRSVASLESRNRLHSFYSSKSQVTPSPNEAIVHGWPSNISSTANTATTPIQAITTTLKDDKHQRVLNDLVRRNNAIVLFRGNEEFLLVLKAFSFY